MVTSDVLDAIGAGSSFFGFLGKSLVRVFGEEIIRTGKGAVGIGGKRSSAGEKVPVGDAGGIGEDVGD